MHRPGASTFDPNIGMQYGYDTVPHLARVDITGPYHASGPGDTPSRRRIFVCHPARPRTKFHVLERFCPTWFAALFAARPRMPISSPY